MLLMHVLKGKKKSWLPKGQKGSVRQALSHKQASPLRQSSPKSKQQTLDRTIRKPVGTPKPMDKSGGIRLSNSFGPIARMDKAGFDVERDHDRVPLTFLDVFETALSSRAKGKGRERWGNVLRGVFPQQRSYEYPLLEH